MKEVTLPSLNFEDSRNSGDQVRLLHSNCPLDNTVVDTETTSTKAYPCQLLARIQRVESGEDEPWRRYIHLPRYTRLTRLSHIPTAYGPGTTYTKKRPQGEN